MELMKKTKATIDPETGFLTTYIRPLSLPELKDRCKAECISINIKWHTHLDIPDKYFDKIISDKPDAGVYCFDTSPRLQGETYEYQFLNLPSGWHMPHPAALIQAAIIFRDQDKHSQYLLNDWWSRTSCWSTLVAEGTKVRLHARVGFVADYKERDPHYLVEFFFPDDRKSPKTGVLCMQKQK